MADREEVKTFAETLDEAARRYGGKEAVVFDRRRETFSSIKSQVDALARGLHKAGVRCGENVAIWMPNSPEWIVGFFAVSRLGGIPVLVNSRYKSYELEHILRNSDATALLMGDRFGDIEFAEILAECCPEIKRNQPGALRSQDFPHLKNIVVFGQSKYSACLSVGDVVRLGDGVDLSQMESSETPPDQPALMFYTSGTTGLPKGCLLSLRAAHLYSQVISDRLQIHDRDIVLSAAPFFHMFGLYSHLLAAVMKGAKQVVVSAFQPGNVLSLIQSERITVLNGVPSMFISLFGHPDFPFHDLKSLCKGLVGGAPCPPDIMERIIDPVNGLGMLALNAYALTESGGPVTFTSPDDSISKRCTTVGKPISEAEIRIVDPETGRTLGLDLDGEIWIRNPGNMLGYYKNQTATAEKLRDGWLITGDMGRIDEDGYLTLTGRISDLVISGGFNVYPREIEDFLRRHPGVQDIAVVGVPDARLGEAVMAFVVPKVGHAISLEAVTHFCKGKIANFKQPKYVEVVDALPMVGVGKVQKFKLREMFLEKYRERR